MSDTETLKKKMKNKTTQSFKQKNGLMRSHSSNAMPLSSQKGDDFKNKKATKTQSEVKNKRRSLARLFRFGKSKEEKTSKTKTKSKSKLSKQNNKKSKKDKKKDQEIAKGFGQDDLESKSQFEENQSKEKENQKENQKEKENQKLEDVISNDILAHYDMIEDFYNESDSQSEENQMNNKKDHQINLSETPPPNKIDDPPQNEENTNNDFSLLADFIHPIYNKSNQENQENQLNQLNQENQLNQKTESESNESNKENENENESNQENQENKENKENINETDKKEREIRASFLNKRRKSKKDLNENSLLSAYEMAENLDDDLEDNDNEYLFPPFRDYLINEPELDNWSYEYLSDFVVHASKILTKNEKQEENQKMNEISTKKQSEELKEAIFQFNRDIKRGIKHCFDSKILPNTPLDVAVFLHSIEGLSKKQVGEFLGMEKPFYLQVLNFYAQLFNFENVSIDDALRVYLSSFRIPGEAQKIDRIMEGFAKQYHFNNPSLFSSSDTVYILAFSIIMLNTDSHNSMVKNKMTKQEFIKTCANIDNGKDLPKEFLSDIYDRITKNEITVTGSNGQSETITFANPEKKGWLTKQGGHYKNWKKRWFLLSYNCLYYFKSEKDSKPRGIIPLDGVTVEIQENLFRKKKFIFEIQSTGKYTKGAKFSGGEFVSGNHEKYLIRATTKEELDGWVLHIQNSIAGNEISKMFDEKKKNLTKK